MWWVPNGSTRSNMFATITLVVTTCSEWRIESSNTSSAPWGFMFALRMLRRDPKHAYKNINNAWSSIENDRNLYQSATDVVLNADLWAKQIVTMMIAILCWYVTSHPACMTAFGQAFPKHCLHVLPNISVWHFTSKSFTMWFPCKGQTRFNYFLAAVFWVFSNVIDDSKVYKNWEFTRTHLLHYVLWFKNLTSRRREFVDCWNGLQLTTIDVHIQVEIT